VSSPTEPSLKAAMTGLMGGERSGRLAHITSKPGQDPRALNALRFGSKKIQHSKRFTTFIANIEKNSWGKGSRRGNLVNWPRGIARCRPPDSAKTSISASFVRHKHRPSPKRNWIFRVYAFIVDECGSKR
jgi:hypothetical protein